MFKTYCHSIAVLQEVKKLANLRLSGAADAQLRVRLLFYFMCVFRNVHSSILHVLMLRISRGGIEWEFMTSVFLFFLK